MSYDEDPPTRRLPLPPREPLPRERVPPADPGATGPLPPVPPAGGISEVQLYDLEQRLASMRTWLTALAVLSVIALGVAAFALISAGDDDSSSRARTPAALREDVEQLEERVNDRATKGQLANVREDIDELKTSVAEASSAASDSGDTTTTTESTDVSGLQNDLSDLSARVEALEEAAPADGAAPDGTTAP